MEAKPEITAGISVSLTGGFALQGQHALDGLSQLLYFSAGITRAHTYAGGEIYFRAAACTGALYEIELCLACGPLRDLEAGLYHFVPREFGLCRLRAGDYRGVLVEATAAEPSIVHAPLIVICTGTYCGMPGNIRHARIAILAGTTAHYSPTCWP